MADDPKIVEALKRDIGIVEKNVEAGTLKKDVQRLRRRFAELETNDPAMDTAIGKLEEAAAK